MHRNDNGINGVHPSERQILLPSVRKFVFCVGDRLKIKEVVAPKLVGFMTSDHKSTLSFSSVQGLRQQPSNAAVSQT